MSRTFHAQKGPGGPMLFEMPHEALWALLDRVYDSDEWLVSGGQIVGHDPLRPWLASEIPATWKPEQFLPAALLVAGLVDGEIENWEKEPGWREEVPWEAAELRAMFSELLTALDALGREEVIVTRVV